MSPWFRRKPPPEEEPARLVSHAPADERRCAHRQESEIPASVVTPSGDIEVMVVNASPMGLCLTSQHRFTPGQDVCVRFVTPDDRPLVHHILVRGRCRWSGGSNRKDLPWRCGVQFNPMTISEHIGLVRFFLEHFSLRFTPSGDKRRQTRLAFDRAIRAVVYLEAQARTVVGTVNDISIDGISVLLPERVEVATKLSVTLQGGVRHKLLLRGQVIHVRKQGDNHFIVGIVTLLTTDGDRRLLTDMIIAAGREPEDDTGLPPIASEEEAPIKEVTPWRPTVAPEVSTDRSEFLDLYGLDSGRLHRGEKKDDSWRPPWEQK